MSEKLVDEFISTQRNVYRNDPGPSVDNIGFPQGSVFSCLDTSVKTLAGRAEKTSQEAEVCNFLKAALNCTRKGDGHKNTLPDLLNVIKDYMTDKNREVRYETNSQNGDFERAIIEAKILDISFRMLQAHANKDTESFARLKQERGMYVEALKSHTESNKSKESKFLKGLAGVETWENKNYHST